MLHTPENFDTAFDVLSDSLNKLDSFSYVGMTQEDYFEAAGVLADATEYVVNVTDVFVLLMDAVNDAYMVLLTSGRAIVDGTVRQHCLKIIDMALDAIYDRVLPAEDSFDSFVAIEGVQEKLSTQLWMMYTVPIWEEQSSLDSVKITRSFSSLRDSAQEAAL